MTDNLYLFPEIENINSSVCSAQAVQNLGLAIVSIISGMIVDKGGYFMLETFFLASLWSKYPFSKHFVKMKF